MEQRIRMLLDLYPLDELFDILDIEVEEVIAILIRGGHAQLPEFIEAIDG